MNTVDFNLRTEQRLMGTLVHYQNLIKDRIHTIRDEYFTDPHNMALLPLLKEMYRKGIRTNITSIYQKCKEAGILEKVGGTSYIAGLECSESSELIFESDRHHLIRNMKERKLADLSVSMNSDIDNISPAEFHEKMRDIFSDDDENESVVSLSDAIQDLIDNPDTIGIDTGFIELDYMVGGFEPGELIILGARPSIGKTALALSMAKNIAKTGIPVQFISLETSIRKLTKRLIISDIKRDDIFSDNLFHSHEIDTDIEKLKKLPIYIDKGYDTSINGILNITLDSMRKNNINFVFIDYLQLVKFDNKAENRNLELSEITRSLKQFALRENMIVVALSQVSRKCDGRMPMLSDLRDSGAIEQDADKVIFLNRPEHYGIYTYKDGSTTKGICDIKIAKNKDGATGDFQLTFLAKYTAFENLYP